MFQTQRVILTARPWASSRSPSTGEEMTACKKKSVGVRLELEHMQASRWSPYRSQILHRASTGILVS